MIIVKHCFENRFCFDDYFYFFRKMMIVLKKYSSFLNSTRDFAVVAETVSSLGLAVVTVDRRRQRTCENIIFCKFICNMPLNQ